MEYGTLKIIGESLSAGIPVTMTLGVIMPVYCNAREAGGIPSPTLGIEPVSKSFDVACSEIESNSIYNDLKGYLKRNGTELGYILEPTGIFTSEFNCMLVVHKGRGDDVIEVKETLRESRKELSNLIFDKSCREGIIKQGNLFGYSQCCVNLYAEDKMDALRRSHEKDYYLDFDVEGVIREMGKETAHRRAIGTCERRVQMQLNEFVKDGDIRSVPPHISNAFFTPFFFPCKPECTESRKTGERILDYVGRIDPDLVNVYGADLFPGHIMQVQSLHPKMGSMIDMALTEKFMGEMRGFMGTPKRKKKRKKGR